MFQGHQKTLSIDPAGKKPYYTYYTPICYTKAFPKLLPSNGSLYFLAAKQVELCVTNLINEMGFP